MISVFQFQTFNVKRGEIAYTFKSSSQEWKVRTPEQIQKMCMMKHRCMLEDTFIESNLSDSWNCYVQNFLTTI